MNLILTGLKKKKLVSPKGQPNKKQNPSKKKVSIILKRLPK